MTKKDTATDVLSRMSPEDADRVSRIIRQEGGDIYPPSSTDPPFFAKVMAKAREEEQLIDPWTIDGPRRIPPAERARELKWTRAEDRRLIEDITSRDYRTCYLCEQTLRPTEPVHIDHIIPRSLGGRNVPSNLGVTHRTCNARKGERLTRKRPRALGGTLTYEEAIQAASG